MRKRDVVESCMDFASAVSTKSRFNLSYKYSSVMRVGRWGLFLQALRHDAEGMSDYSDPVINIRQLRATAGIYGLSTVDIASVKLENGRNVVERISDYEYCINIKSMEELIKCCYLLWKNARERGFIEKRSIYLVRVLHELRVPKKKEDLFALFGEQDKVRHIISHLTDLGLIIELGEYYMNPELFKMRNEKTLDTITEFDILPDKYIDSVDRVSKTPGLPLETFDEKLHAALLELGRVGILLPIEVEVPNFPPKRFVFADPTETRNSNLSYETAAYFRFNEIYANPQFGRLNDLPAFLDKLLDKGFAGEATNIGRNYIPLLMKGVFDVIHAETSGWPVLVLRKRDVVQETAVVLQQKCEDVLSWKKPPIWINDPAATRAAYANHMENSFVDLKKWFKDNV